MDLAWAQGYPHDSAALAAQVFLDKSTIFVYLPPIARTDDALKCGFFDLLGSAMYI